MFDNDDGTSLRMPRRSTRGRSPKYPTRRGMLPCLARMRSISSMMGLNFRTLNAWRFVHQVLFRFGTSIPPFCSKSGTYSVSSRCIWGLPLADLGKGKYLQSEEFRSLGVDADMCRRKEARRIRQARARALTGSTSKPLRTMLSLKCGRSVCMRMSLNRCMMASNVSRPSRRAREAPRQ